MHISKYYFNDVKKVLFHYNLEKKKKSLVPVNEETIFVSKEGINHHSSTLVYRWWFQVVHSSAGKFPERTALICLCSFFPLQKGTFEASQTTFASLNSVV